MQLHLSDLFGLGHASPANLLTLPADMSSELTAIGTLILAIGAIVTALLAGLALRKQAQEVRTIERQVRDQAQLTEQQAELIRLQAEQGQLQRQQIEEQRAVNARQAELTKLQTQELRESLRERRNDSWRRYSAQASRVFVTTEVEEDVRKSLGRVSAFTVISRVRNTSEQPVYRVTLYRNSEAEPDVLALMGTIMPGEDAQASINLPLKEAASFSSYVRFLDAAGTEWQNMPDDRLLEVRSDSLFTEWTGTIRHSD